MTVGENVPLIPSEKKPRLSLKLTKNTSPMNTTTESLVDTTDFIGNGVTESQSVDPQPGDTASREDDASMLPVNKTEKPARPCINACQSQDVPCITGLDNMGNTCFMNSVLQILRYTPGFVENLSSLAKQAQAYEKQCKNKEKICDDNVNGVKLQLQLVIQLDKLYERMELHEENFAKDNSQRISTKPERVLDIIRQLNPMFEGTLQHDTQELLRCLLTYIQDASKVFTSSGNTLGVQDSIKTVDVVNSVDCTKDSVDNGVVKNMKENNGKQSKLSSFFKLNRSKSEKKASNNYTLSPKKHSEKFSFRKSPLGQVLSPKSKVFNINEVAESVSDPCSNHHNLTPKKWLNYNGMANTVVDQHNGHSIHSEEKSSSSQNTRPVVSPRSKKLQARDVLDALEKLDVTKPLSCSTSDSGIGTSPKASSCNSMSSTSEPDLTQWHGSGRKRALSASSETEANITKKPKPEQNQDIQQPDTEKRVKAKVQTSIFSAFAKGCKKFVRRLGMRGAAVKVEITPEKDKDKPQNEEVQTHYHSVADNHVSHQVSNNQIKTELTENGMMNIDACSTQQPNILSNGTDQKLHKSPVVTLTKMSRSDVEKYSPRNTQSASHSKKARKSARKKFENMHDSQLVASGDANKKVDFIEDLFQGSMVLQTRCQECETCTKRHEVYQDISVPVRRSSHQDESDDEGSEKQLASGEMHSQDHTWLIDALSEVEHLRDDNKYFCENCSGLVEAQRSIVFETLPNILTLHLKRFEANSGSAFCGISKINDFAATPLVIPCIKSSCAKNCHDVEHRYELYGVIMHAGISISSGHYILYVQVKPKSPSDTMQTTTSKTPSKTGSLLRYSSSKKEHVSRKEERVLPRESTKYAGKWIQCDDDKVTVLEGHEFTTHLNQESQTPYLLFYRKLSLNNMSKHNTL